MRSLGIKPDTASFRFTETQIKLREHLRKVNASGGRSARKQKILDAIEKQVGDNSLQDLVWWRDNRKLIENFFDELPDHLLSAQHETIDWTVSSVRGFASRFENIVSFDAGSHRAFDILSHEFAHHLEFRAGESVST